MSSVRGRYRTRAPILKPTVQPTPSTRQTIRSIWYPTAQSTNGDINLILEPIEERSSESVAGPLSEAEAYELDSNRDLWDVDDEWDDEGLDETMDEEE